MNSIYKLFVCLLCGTFCLAWLAGVVPAANVRTVALSGQPVPGAPSGTTFRFLNDLPALNIAGETAFKARLINNGTDLGSGIMSEGSGILNLVVAEGNQAPGMPNGLNYFSVGRPVLNAAGQTAFYAIARENSLSPTYSGAWKEHLGNVELVAVDGTPAPGTPGGVAFHGLIDGRVLLNDAGHTLFSAFVIGSSVNSSNDIGIWSDSLGSLGLLAREGDQAVGMSSGVLFNGLAPPVLNDAGISAFAGSVTGSGSEFVQDGIWLGRPGNLNLVVRDGNPAPGTSSGVNFLTFSALALNNAGHTAFRGFLTGSGVTSTNDQGIWSEGSGTLALVAREGSAAPGTPSGANFAGFSSPVLNAVGRTAFSGTISGGGVDDLSNSGIWSDNSGGLQLVIREGSQAPGTPSGAKFSTFGSPTLNSAGQIAFASTLLRPLVDRNGNPIPGDYGGVDATNDTGIWATDVNGILRLVARKGDPLEVAPADFRTISSLDFFTSTGNEDGNPSSFNDLGQLAFLATFTDGSSGVFVSNAVAIPEPASIALAGLALISFFARGSRTH